MKLSIGFTGDRSLKDQIGVSRYAEETGYDSVWLADHYCLREIVACATAIALHTERINVGTGVLNPYTRHPATVAMFVRTLQEMVGPRILLGVGAGLRPQYHLLGREIKKPNAAVREWLSVMKRLFNDEKVSFQGETLNVKDLKLEFGYGLPPPPFYIGAVGRKMVELAATQTDGLLVTAGSSVGYVKEATQWTLSAMKRTGREPASFEIAVLVIFSASEHRKEAKDATKKWISTLAAQPSESSAQFIDDALVDEVAVAGTPEDCIARMKQYEATGITNLVLVPMSTDPIRELELIRAKT